MTYYKYRTDSSYTEQIITSGKVYLSTAEGLNDPFECSLQEIGKEWIQKKILEMKQAAVSGFIFQAKSCLDTNGDFFGLSTIEISQVLENIKKLENLDEVYTFYFKFITERTGHTPSDCDRLFARIDSQLLDVGIFSMTGDPQHPLMWPHYAGDHTGICLGFDQAPGSLLANPEHFLPVIYSDSLPELSGNGFITQMNFSVNEKGIPYTSSFKIAFSDKTFQKAITTKATCWKHEEEWRYIEPYGGLFDWPGPLSEVIFGLRCKEERINHYIQLLENNVPYPVRLYRMSKKYGTNEVQMDVFDKPVTEPKVSVRPSTDKNAGPIKLSEHDFSLKMEKLIKEEKYGDALFQIDENLKINPHSPRLIHLKGVAHGFAHEHEKALECFIQLTNAFPKVPTGWYHMATALIELERHDEAVTALRKAYELDPNDRSTVFNLAIELLRTQDDPKEPSLLLKRAHQLGDRRAFGILSEIEKLTNK